MRDRLLEILRPVSGIDPLGFVEDAPEPSQSWKLVAAGLNPPLALRLPEDDVQHINAELRRCLVLHFGEGPWTLLFSLGGLGQLPWLRVSVESSKLHAMQLTLAMGAPEFLVCTEDGQRLLGVTSEEHEVWVRAFEGAQERKLKNSV